MYVFFVSSTTTVINEPAKWSRGFFLLGLGKDGTKEEATICFFSAIGFKITAECHEKREENRFNSASKLAFFVASLYLHPLIRPFNYAAHSPDANARERARDIKSARMGFIVLRRG